MRKYIVLAFLLLFTLFAHSQTLIVDGPANVREKPHGRIILTLDDGVSVECSGVASNWLYLRLLTILHKSEFTGEKDVVIAKDKLLINEAGVKIGKTLDSLKGRIIEAYDSGKFLAMVEGVTHKNNIRESSLIEDDIEKILNESSGIDFDKFEDYYFKIILTAG